MTDPINPLASKPAHENNLDRRVGHTHPEPRWLRWALISFSLALALILALVGYAIHQTGVEAAKRQRETLAAARMVAQSNYTQCLERRSSAQQSVDAYSAALAKLRPPPPTGDSTTGVVRDILTSALNAAQRGVLVTCTPPPPSPPGQ